MHPDLPNKRKKTNNSRILDGRSDHFLVLNAVSAVILWDDFAEPCEKSSNRSYIFVVYVFDFLCAKFTSSSFVCWHNICELFLYRGRKGKTVVLPVKIHYRQSLRPYHSQLLQMEPVLLEALALLLQNQQLSCLA